MKAFILLFLLFAQAALCSEPVEPVINDTVVDRGFIGTDYLSTTTTTKGKVSTTSGYIGTKPVRLTTTQSKAGTTTTGWIDGKYIRIETPKPKDQKD